jgi:hypothetical protein
MKHTFFALILSAALACAGTADLKVDTQTGQVVGQSNFFTGNASAIGAALSTTYQPLDSDLTALAALATTTFGRSLITQTDAAAARSTLGLSLGSNVQAWDADLDSIAALVTTAFGRSLLIQANAAAARTTLGLGIGTDVQAYDSDLSTLASGTLPNVSSGTWTSGRAVNLTLSGTSFVTGLLDVEVIDTDSLKIKGVLVANQPQWTVGLEKAMMSIASAIKANRSTGAKFVGDSLGSGNDEYVRLFLNYITTTATNHRVRYDLITPNADPTIRVWSSTILQAGNGEAYWQFSATTTNSFGVTFNPIDAPPPTGNFDVECKFRVDNWEAQDGRQIWTWDGSTSPNLTSVCGLRLNDNRRQQFTWYDGSGTFRSALTGNLGTIAGNVVATAPSDGTTWTSRVRANLAYTASTSQIIFAKSTDDGASWTTMQTVEVSGTGIWNPASKPVLTLGGVPGFPLTSARIYKIKVRDGWDGPTTNLLPIDLASQGSNGNTVLLQGSPEIVFENWSYPGTTTSGLLTEIFGTQQQETATAAGTISGSGDATVVVTGSTAITGAFSSTLAVAVTSGDTAATWASKVRSAIQGNSALNSIYETTGFGTAILLTRREPAAANDSTLNVSLNNGTSTGITAAATSANTTAGVVSKLSMFGNNGDAWISYAGGMNDGFTGPYTHSSEWLFGSQKLINGLKSRAPLAHPILIAMNPRVSVPGNVQPQQFIDAHGYRSSLLAKYAAEKGYGFIGFYQSFLANGANNATNIPDGVHPSSDAVLLYEAPLLYRAYDAVKP